MPGVELILTRLHAGGKFNDKNYKFPAACTASACRVVNALSKQLECWIKRDGKEYNISFTDGKVASKLEVVGSVGKRNTGTTVRFWPDPKYFDSREVLRAAAQARAQGQGRAVPGPARSPFENEATGEKDEWYYTDGLRDYLREALKSARKMCCRPSRSSAQASKQDRQHRRLGRGLGARRRNARWRKATST